jgi:hypothetical protein
MCVLRNPLKNDLKEHEIAIDFNEFPILRHGFEKRILRLIHKEKISFFKLPRIIQWFFVGSVFAESKLRLIEKILSQITGKNKNLDRKINEWLTFKMDDNQLFNTIVEFNLLSNILKCTNVNEIKYEPILPGTLKTPDILVCCNSNEYLVEVTHRDDKYPLSELLETLLVNMKFIFPEYGGIIGYKPPVLFDIENQKFIKTVVPTFMEVIKFVEDICNGNYNVKDGKIHFLFKDIISIVIDKKSNVWLTKPIYDWRYTNVWYYPSTSTYIKSIQKKIERYSQINGHYKLIIYLDCNPSSDFIDDGCYREELKDQLSQSNILVNSTISAVVSGITRFDTGSIDGLSTLWSQNDAIVNDFKNLLVPAKNLIII